jgi:thioredoxin-like negative regulator of GroEL
MPLESMKSQELFETLWFHTDPAPLPNTRAEDRAWIQYHTAKWCGPCKQLDIESLVKVAEERGLTVWKIDVDENDYTSGYCGVRSIPTWQFCVPKKIVSTVQNSSTEKVAEWIRQW